MPKPKDVYVKCDELENIPELNKKNWLFENYLLAKILPKNATVLQIGCMDATRILSLLELRPDLEITGLDIDKEIVNKAKENLKKSKKKAAIILRDITKIENRDVGNFDYVVCLNNTLGYISDEKKAIENMKKLGKKVIISVYSEKFTDKLGLEYFNSIDLKIKKVENNVFYSNDFVNIKRYTKEDVGKWDGKVTKTPIGYFCVF